jgi:KaiC/GvpD/RAD55 family RecA-like ATPase
LLPDIVGFKDLFPRPSEEGDAGENKTGTAKLGKAGLPNGSCILLAGPPGSGKTIFALSLVRSLMKARSASRLCFISTEINRRKLARDLREFYWFRDDSPKDDVFSTDRVDIPEMPDLGLYHEARGAGSLVDLALRQTTKVIEERAEADKDKGEVFVVIDSLTAMLKDSKSAGERRAQASRCIKNLYETMFHDRLALLFVLSEDCLDSGASSDAPPEEYLADIVFRLGVKDTGAGCRLRTLEITKSRAAKMLLGEHSFAIVTDRGINDVIAQERTRDLVKSKMAGPGPDGDPEHWGTVVVAPRTHLRPVGEDNSVPAPESGGRMNPAGGGTPRGTPRSSEPKWLCSGTPLLDAMLLGRFAETGHRNGAESPGLQAGGTTLILGSTGTGKTTLCLQFLLEHAASTVGPAGSRVDFGPTIAGPPHPQLTAGTGELYDIAKLRETLYVNFENRPCEVIEKFPGSKAAQDALRRCGFLFRHRRNLNVNLLLLELANALRPSGLPQVRRVVIDGLSDLI